MLTSSRPRPFRQFVLKVHSRCDLACDHCYVYRHADATWAGRPQVIADDTVRHTARRIAEHAAAHRLAQVHVVLHGGEPLLAGRERLRQIARELRASLRGVSALDLRMQTNGLLLDEEFCAMLAAEQIRTGISLDGDEAAHDRHRRRANGSGSHADVVRAVRLIGSRPYRAAFSGLLCTIDVENDPVAVYEALAELDPPRADFLLPHATWDRPPARPAGDGAAYARWLITIYDRWVAGGRPLRIRLFDSIEAAEDDAPGFTEALGLGSPDLVVVETDGEIEQADWLKTVAHGAAATGFHVDRDSFDDAAAHPGFEARRNGLAGLSEVCRSCSVVRVCGGGLFAHRHRSGTGFDNPSVYCADLYGLIRHIQRERLGTPPPRKLSLAVREFDQLASGRGGRRALSALVTGQQSVHRTLIAAARASLGADADTAWETLTRVDRRSAEAVAAVFAQPFVGGWAARVAEGGDDTESPTDAGRLREIAVAASCRSEHSTRMLVPTRNGTVQLPLLGRLAFEEPWPAQVELESRDGALFLHCKGTRWAVADGPLPPGVSWQPVRFLRLAGRDVVLEDTDPFRDVFDLSARQPLSPEQMPHWQSALDAAWRIVRTRYSRHSVGVELLPVALIPLQASGGEGAVEVAEHCFGAVGLALPDDPAVLAGLLLDAVQGIKLWGIRAMFDLADPTDRRLHGSPPRHAEEILRDLYLRVVRPAPGAAEDLAALAEASLTPLGRRMTAGLRTELSPTTEDA
jgi:uncharacterized protein